MDCSVLALDLDGTLTDSSKRIGQRGQSAIFRAIERGVTVVLASGRPLIGIDSVVRTLQLSRRGGYVLGFNGARIVECKTGRVVFERLLSTEVVVRVGAFAKNHGLVCVGYDEHGILTEVPDDPHVAIEAYNNGIPIQKIPDLPAALHGPQPKMMVVGDPTVLQRVLPSLETSLDGLASVGFSEPYFLEITYPGVHKASSLEALLHLLGKQWDEVMAFGDGLNDIPLLDAAGFSVAMGNAAEAVQSHAKVVADSNDDDGVAKVVERYLLDS